MSELPETAIRPRARRSERITIAIVMVMIAACGVALWQRDRIRAWYWARALARAESLQERSYYVTMLAGLRGAAVPAVSGLLSDPRADVRSLAVAVLVHGKTARARAALMSALHDPDSDVRDDAAHALAFAYGRDALSDLQREIPTARGEAALAMCVAIGRSDDPAATAILIDSASQHPEADVRAQAAERLGYRRSPVAEAALRRMCEDKAPVTQRLYDERLVEKAQAFVHAKSGSPASSGAASSTLNGSARTVGDVAAHALRRLMAAPTTMPAGLPSLGDSDD